jgi:hypothetical protein
MTGTPNVIKAVTDHAEKDASAADAELDQMAAEFAAACLQYGELIGLDKFSRAVAKARAQASGKKEPPASSDVPTGGETAAHRPRATSSEPRG